MSQALEIEIGDQFFKPRTGHSKWHAPDRTYTVERIDNLWSVWCKVDPPLKDGTFRTFVEQRTLLRMQRIPKESNADN